MTYINTLLQDKKKLEKDLAALRLEKMMQVNWDATAQNSAREREHILETEIHILDMLLRRKGVKR